VCGITPFVSKSFANPYIIGGRLLFFTFSGIRNTLVANHHQLVKIAITIIAVTNVFILLLLLEFIV